MPTTPHHGIPYPVGTVGPNGPQALQDIATSLDNHAKFLQGTLAARPAAGSAGRFYYAEDNGVIYRDSGSAWVALHAVPLVTSWPPTAALVVDGMIIDYDLGAGGAIWRLRYRAGSTSTYKWEVIAAPDIFAEVPSAAGEATTSASYVDLATVGPAITLPRDGDYYVSLGVSAWDDNATEGTVAASFMSYAIGATAAVDADSIQGVNDPDTQFAQFQSYRTRLKTSMVAGTVLTAKYRSGGAGLSTKYRYRTIRARPKRIA